MLKSKETHRIKWQEASNEPAQEPDGERERERKVKKAQMPEREKKRCDEVLKERVTVKPLEVIA